MEFRRPTIDERRLLLELAGLAKLNDPPGWVNSLMVRDMSDGGMGSLEIEGEQGSARPSGVTPMASLQFSDEDGVDVIVTLNSGENGKPFELDIWKTDFSPLRHIPRVFHGSETDQDDTVSPSGTTSQ